MRSYPLVLSILAATVAGTGSGRATDESPAGTTRGLREINPPAAPAATLRRE